MEDFELCRKKMEEDVGHSPGSPSSVDSHISVPSLSTTHHIDLMHGASACESSFFCMYVDAV